ncbi:hypothetical protein PPERSA_03475 [Pseudocohnilembus persalinus]|uniref:EF-hand domain-containing protein n=1 Tax=Pseudocohnilembus persalinus TaxID=266149 RepID=A0A0V0QBZ5_PSEPJ|nr:hypothetical protein PPERSA_03475 [Pseudocohnilembus persalinus]|eukprot:KRW99674.1 hypothetical protein PPERSA_03475 [Pseudocohnilembus persalinus]
MRKQSNLYRGSRVQQQNPSNYKFNNLDTPEIEFFINAFQKEDPNKYGLIQENQLQKIIGYRFQVDNKVKDRVKKEINDKNYQQIDIQVMLNIVSLIKEFIKKNKEREDQIEYIDAFIALGGNNDLTGTVSRQTIMDIITNEFDLSIDMTSFLEKLEIYDENLDFPTFCQVFENEERALSRAGSLASLHSARSRTNNHDNNFGLEQLGKKQDEEFKTLKIRYRDFERYYQEVEEKERMQKIQDHQNQDQY